MKRTLRITESELRRLISKGIREAINESFNQFSDSDFGSTGNPYELEDQYTETILDGNYGSFNSIEVEIENDGQENPYIRVTAKDNGNTVEFEGEEAQNLLDKIKDEARNVYDSTPVAMYRNLMKFVVQ